MAKDRPAKKSAPAPAAPAPASAAQAGRRFSNDRRNQYVVAAHSGSRTVLWSNFSA